MAAYTYGNGHIDLAKALMINHAESIAVSGCNNSRIIRSTLKHCYLNEIPTLYVLGMTFLSRWELPINSESTELDGHWINPQALPPNGNYLNHWTADDTETFKNLMFKAYIPNFADSLEDLMYRLVALDVAVRNRGHKLLVYNQVETEVQEHVNDPKFVLLHDRFFVDKFAWPAVVWQHNQNVPTQSHTVVPQRRNLVATKSSSPPPPLHFQHRKPGEHHLLNQYLVNYIKNNHIMTA
jgi:hypothetical protein